MIVSNPTRRHVLAVAVLASSLHASRADTPLVLRIGYLKAPNDLTLAKAHGSLERALATLGGRVEWAGPFAAAAPAVEALNAGAIDMTVGSSTSFITSRAAGVDLVMFGYQRMLAAAEGILVGREAKIHSVRDLIGHSVAVNRGGSGEYILVRALNRAGVPLDQVKRVYLAPTDASAAFSSGAVDAWATWDPFLSIAIANGADVLANGADSGSENAVAFFVSGVFLKANRRAVEIVLSVLEQENAWARANVGEAGTVWAREMGLPASLGRSLGDNNTAPIGPVTSQAAEQIEHIADWYKQNRIVPSRPEISPFLVDLRLTQEKPQ